MKRSQTIVGVWCFLQMAVMQGMESGAVVQVTSEPSLEDLVFQEHQAYVGRLEALIMLQGQILANRDAHIEKQHAMINRLKQLLETVKREDELDWATQKKEDNIFEVLPDGQK